MTASLARRSFFLVPHRPLADPPCMKVCSYGSCRLCADYTLRTLRLRLKRRE